MVAVAKVESYVGEDGLTPTGEKALMFLCPGCDQLHAPRVGKSATREHPVWTWNGDVEKPTLSPSIKVTWHEGPERRLHVCHSFLRNGVMEFLGDCTHPLAGKHVPLAPWKEGN